MSYNVTLNKKLPEQGVYDQLLGGHIVNRKQVKLYPRSGSGTFTPRAQPTIQFRLPSHGYIDCLRSYMTYTLRVKCDVTGVRHAHFPAMTVGTSGTTLSTRTINTVAGFQRMFDVTADGAETIDPTTSFVNEVAHTTGLSVDHDPCAYMLGGHNGSTASPFRLMRTLYDGEPVENIDNYNGLVAMLSMNISEGYRRSALGNMQFLSPRGAKEMILNALVRGGSSSLKPEINTADQPIAAMTAGTMYTGTNYRGWNGKRNALNTGNGIKTAAGNAITTTYKDLIHMPISGILGNSKLLPVKFLGNLDVEFELAPVQEVIQVASALGVNKFVSTHLGATVAGPARLDFKRGFLWNADGLSASTDYRVRDWATHVDDTHAAQFLWELIFRFVSVTSTGMAAFPRDWNTRIGAPAFNQNGDPDNILTDRFLNSITYEIADPVYHFEIVYMSEAYDAAFADALTRGVTYAYETYTATNAPVRGDGAVHVPVSKTSIKAVFAGFINQSMTGNLLTNHWHFYNPHLQEYQCKFGAKLVPQEPMRVDADYGLQALMMYLKAVNMHYNPLAGFHYNWVVQDPSMRDNAAANTTRGVDGVTAFGALGCTEPGPATWCYNSVGLKNDAYRDDVHRMFDTNYPANADLNNPESYTRRESISGYGFGGSNYLRATTVDGYDKRLAASTWEYNIGSFAIGLDLETEQDALSGINTAGSTAALQWVFKFQNQPRGPVSLYTWVLHDKALRFEPFGRASVIVD